MKRGWVGAAVASLAYSLAAGQGQVDYSKLEVKTTELGHGVYLLGWRGGDSLILVGDEGVLLVDTSVAQMGEKIKAAIARVSNKPIRLIINTHAHPDHFGANESLATNGALIVGHDRLRERMASGQFLAAFNQSVPPSKPAALPSITYSDAMTIHFDGETVQLFHPPRAHTDSDTLVYFKQANVIHASGTFGGAGTYPFFDMSSGGTLTGMIAAEERMLALADDKTTIIADEGDPASTSALRASRDMLVAVRGRIQKLIDEGKTEQESVAAKPTRDLDGQWMQHGGFMSGDRFTRLAYRSLTQARHPRAP